MALRTGRAHDAAEVVVDHAKCTGCGLCVKVCKGAPLTLEDGRVRVDQDRVFGCIGCGQCMAVCPEECITVRGRDMDPADLFVLPGRDTVADFDSLHGLLRSRRSVRAYRNKEVAQDDLGHILDAVSAAPMGLPPSDVEVLVVQGRDKVDRFAADMVASMARMRWFFTAPMRTLMRPFVGREWTEMSKGFILPIIDTFVEGRKTGEDWLFYGAPLVLYFHAAPYADPLDPGIAATYAMLAAHGLGLGSCMIGTPGHFLHRDKRLMEKYRVPKKNHPGLALIIGHSAVHYRKGLKRRLAGVHKI